MNVNSANSDIRFPLLEGSIPPLALTAIRDVNIDVADSDVWRRDFARWSSRPVDSLPEPPPGVTFQNLRYGMRASVMKRCHKPLTQQDKLDLIAYKRYLHPDRPVDVEQIMAYEPPDRNAVAPVRSPEARKRKILVGAVACLVSAGVLGTVFLLRVLVD